MKAKYVRINNPVSFMHQGYKHINIAYIPAETNTIAVPHLIAGKPDGGWTCYKGTRPALTDKAGWEKQLGLKLLPIS